MLCWACQCYHPNVTMCMDRLLLFFLYAIDVLCNFIPLLWIMGNNISHLWSYCIIYGNIGVIMVILVLLLERLFICYTGRLSSFCAGRLVISCVYHGCPKVNRGKI